MATPADLASELLATNDEVLLVGDGALRHRATFAGISRFELADQGMAYPHAGSLVQLAHARALREEFVGPGEAHPAVPPQARRRDQLADAGLGGLMAHAGAAPRPDPADVEVVIGPMRRRHLRGVLRIEQQVYPRPWSLGLFMSELGFGSSRVYVVARIGGTGRRLRRAHAGRRRRPHHHAGRRPPMAPPRDRHPAARTRWPGPASSAAPRTSPSRCGSATSPPRACTGRSASRRRGSARATTSRRTRMP